MYDMVRAPIPTFFHKILIPLHENVLPLKMMFWLWQEKKQTNKIQYSYFKPKHHGTICIGFMQKQPKEDLKVTTKKGLYCWSIKILSSTPINYCASLLQCEKLLTTKQKYKNKTQRNCHLWILWQNVLLQINSNFLHDSIYKLGFCHL